MKRFGHNRGYIDELYASYQADPTSVSEAWREFFADYRQDSDDERLERRTAPRRKAAEAAATATPAPAAAAPAAASSAAAPEAAVVDVEPLTGAAARIATNMKASLAVPTATSARTIPVKILEENRRIINQHTATIAGPKISLTHLIGWALVRALVRHPAMNTAFAEVGGKPGRRVRKSIHLGLAVDVERGGERLLVVPNVKGAEQLDFPRFVAAYDDLVVRARQNKLTVDELRDSTVTLTNPGMLGTSLSIPRLMDGQGAIIGVGSLGYPAEYAGMAPEAIAELGLSKVMTVTSTYDHRVIQGAVSGAFLADLEQLLAGKANFYDQLFSELGVPHEPLCWSADSSAALVAVSGSGATAATSVAKQAGVSQLIRSYRVRGHLWADLDPLGYEPEPNSELELSTYGLTVWDLDRRFYAAGLAGSRDMLPLREIFDTLKQTYCQHIGVEYMHIQDPESRQWLQERMEGTRNSDPLPRELQNRILEKLNAAEAFETFLGKNYVGQKRFSLEGAETLIPMLDMLLQDAADSGVEQVLLGMAHRGRLNVLANVIGKSHRQIFREFEGDIDPRTTHGSGDVKYHLGASGVWRTPDGRELEIAVASNPSHLEAVNPVVEGMVRARQDRLGDGLRERVLPVLLHGDAAFSGQGVVAETLNLSQLKGYRTGGTVHIVINNQIGFTTGPAEGRSSHYPTDVAKMVRSPIFHVNGDHPEDAVRVMRLAFAFRQAFKRDVVIDLVCYRRWGHNEADDPSYTHPILYARIQQHRSVRKLYTEQLVRSGDFDLASAERALEDFRRRLTEVHDEVQKAQDEVEPPALPEPDALEMVVSTSPATAAAPETLERVVAGLSRTPAGFTVHPKLVKQLAERPVRFAEGRIDWAFAESLAFGSLVLEGSAVRLSGEDSNRGTFSQRHSTLYDYRTATPWVPLAELAPEQAPFTVYDSLLSEFAVLGFEYGYSVEHPTSLVLWEAQFGDFNNGAQVILDQFGTSAEEKWGQSSGVTLLLPHGYEGQGPEHSSARPERFLQMAARGNIRIAYPSTPAQYFHLLRAQAKDPVRKPLVVLTPKSLLRHRAAVSTAEELTGGRFHEVLDDPLHADAAGVRRVLLCSGKIYYELAARREQESVGDVAICRLERFYPFPYETLSRLLARFASSRDIVWVQEEPKNMGAFSFVRERLEPLLGNAQRLRYVGRPRAASPATGSHKRHLAEQEALIRESLAAESQPTTDRVAAETPARS